MTTVPTNGVPQGTGSGNHDQAYFDELVTGATGALTGDEVLLANLTGERTDFIRLNGSEVRIEPVERLVGLEQDVPAEFDALARF